MNFEAAAVTRDTAAIAASLKALEWITDNRVERLSQDFYWFSPMLKRQLEGLRADAVVRPKTEDEIRAVVARVCPGRACRSPCAAAAPATTASACRCTAA